MENHQSNSLSKRVVKAMSVFGGVQVVNILCSVVRTKLVSIWIGAAGMGLFGVFNSAIDLISQISLMGIGSSGVRDVARSVDDREHCRRTVTIVRRWSLWLGLLGALVTFLLAPLLSRWSFGNADHTTAYRLLSLCILFVSLSQGELSVLQGLSRLKRVARATLFGSIVGLAISIPLFYYYRIDSIIPVLLVSAASALAGTMLFREKSVTSVPSLSLRETIKGGESLIRLGFFITLSAVVSLLASYVLISYLTEHYDSTMAGYFQAGFTLINRYVGLVFTAIALEYFPRLSSVARRRYFTQVYVSHEMKLSLGVLVPLIGAFIVASPLIITILYSSDFEVIEPFIEIGVTGTLLRAVSWCMSFTILVKGDGKIYLLTESLSAMAYVVINIVTINTLGIEGMGYAYVAWYLIYTLIVGAVFRYRYGYRLRRGMVGVIAYSVAMTVAILLLTMLAGRIAGGALTLVAIVVALRILRRS